ncbi:unnamed protein product, partial [Amoebophrya sp. A120]|eukprot:GSA120T00024100001.1
MQSFIKRDCWSYFPGQSRRHAFLLVVWATLSSTFGYGAQQQQQPQLEDDLRTPPPGSPRRHVDDDDPVFQFQTPSPARPQDWGVQPVVVFMPVLGERPARTVLHNGTAYVQPRAIEIVGYQRNMHYEIVPPLGFAETAGLARPALAAPREGEQDYMNNLDYHEMMFMLPPPYNAAGRPASQGSLSLPSSPTTKGVKVRNRELHPGSLASVTGAISGNAVASFQVVRPTSAAVGAVTGADVYAELPLDTSPIFRFSRHCRVTFSDHEVLLPTEENVYQKLQQKSASGALQVLVGRQTTAEKVVEALVKRVVEAEAAGPVLAKLAQELWRQLQNGTGQVLSSASTVLEDHLQGDTVPAGIAEQGSQGEQQRPAARIAHDQSSSTRPDRLNALRRDAPGRLHQNKLLALVEHKIVLQ